MEEEIRAAEALNTDEGYMDLALALAKQAADCGEVPVGAVLVWDGRVAGVGRNRREEGKNALFHAETEAIYHACQSLHGWRLWKGTLYVTLEPCPMCAGAIVNARIPRVVIGAREPKNGACGSGLDLFALKENFRPKAEFGCREAECAAIMQSFFARLRTHL